MTLSPKSDPKQNDPKQLPWGFWRRFLEVEMKVQYTARQRLSFSRALKFVAQRRAEGAASLAAKRGRRRRGSCRGEGGALNRRLAPGLGFALLQYFVDHVQRLMSRSDSTLLMNEARRLRGELAHGGYSDKELPKLIGTAGHTWFLGGGRCMAFT